MAAVLSKPPSQLYKVQTQQKHSDCTLKARTLLHIAATLALVQPNAMDERDSFLGSAPSDAGSYSNEVVPETPPFGRESIKL
jgi:hypothetical protein